MRLMLQNKNACEVLMYRESRCVPTVDCIECYQVQKKLPNTSVGIVVHTLCMARHKQQNDSNERCAV